MNTNLRNVYMVLKRKRPDLEVIYNIPVSYVSSLTGQENYIFVCKKDPSKSGFGSSTMPKLQKKENVNLDLTGSPLKDDCEIDTMDMSFDYVSDNLWNPEEESYSGIEVEKARDILNDITLQQDLKNELGSIWILCNGSDACRSVLMEYGLGNHKNIRGCICYEGIVPTFKVSMAFILKRRQSLYKCNSAITSTVIDSWYKINANMTLKISWAAMSQPPSLNNFKNSDVTLYQKCSIKGSNSCTEDLLNQLEILSIIQEDIITFKESHSINTEATFSCGRGIDFEELKQKVLSLMTELSYELDNCSGGNLSNELDSVIQQVKMRPYIQLTDKLWDVLKCCASYKELKMAMNYVFQCSAKCNIVNMPSNNNRVAEIIREVSQRRLAIPHLSGSEPLELLLEIGLEKLFNDYKYIYTESKLCNEKELLSSNRRLSTVEFDSTNVKKSLYGSKNVISNQRKTLLHTKASCEFDNENENIGFQNSRFNKNEIDNMMNKLLQVHLVLEHMMLMYNNFNMKSVQREICEQLLKRQAKSFRDVFNTYTDQIEISLPMNCVKQDIEDKDPHRRKISITSTNKFREIQSVEYFSMENIFPPDIFIGFEFGEKECLKENAYFHWNYLKIRTTTLE